MVIRHIKRNRKGTFTLYDAGLFFVFLMIASSLIAVFFSSNDTNVDDRLRKAEYCENARRAFLSSTIPSTGYDTGQRYVERKEASVRTLLLEQMFLENKGIPRDNFSYPNDISELGENQFQDDWGLVVCADGSDDIVIDHTGVAPDLFSLKKTLNEDFVASSWKEDGLDSKSVEIIFYYAY